MAFYQVYHFGLTSPRPLHRQAEPYSRHVSFFNRLIKRNTPHSSENSFTHPFKTSTHNGFVLRHGIIV